MLTKHALCVSFLYYFTQNEKLTAEDIYSQSLINILLLISEGDILNCV